MCVRVPINAEEVVNPLELGFVVVVSSLIMGAEN